MNRFSTVVGVITSGIILTACSNTGTTYGTGTSHELATLQGLGSMFELRKKDRPNIDYSARPDLVMPASKNALPSPADQANTGDQNWPVSPEQKIAAVQNDAPVTDEFARNSGGLPVEFALSEKQGINRPSNKRREIKPFDGAVDSTRASGASQILRDIQLGNNKKNRKEAIARSGQLTYTKGSGTRRFLTEPPVEYRTPAATAEASDLGIDEKELTARQKRDARVQ